MGNRLRGPDLSHRTSQLLPRASAGPDLKEGARESRKSSVHEITIGYISPDFFTHSVSYFIEAPLTHHDYTKYKVVVYSAVVKVWSLVRRFDQPQKYKPFVSMCVMKGDIGIGSVREVDVKSGLPATRSTERLELLDDNEHILGIRIVGGDHRLKNYSSVVTVHPEIMEELGQW